MQQFLRVSRPSTTPIGCATAGRSRSRTGGPALLRAIVGEEVVGRRLADPGPTRCSSSHADDDRLRPSRTRGGNGARLLSGREQWCQVSPNRARAATSRHYPLGGPGRDNWIVNGRRSGPASRSSRRGASYSPAPDCHSRMKDYRVLRRPRHAGHHHSAAAHHAWSRRILRGVLRRRGDPGKPDARPTGDGWRLAMDLLPYERSSCFWQRIAYSIRDSTR